MGAVSSSVREYPADAVEFGAWFPNDEACADYLAWLRWGDYEFVCHLCGAVADGSDDDSGIQAAVEAAGDFDYTFITAKRAADPAHILFPAVSRVQAQAKRWLESTAQGAASMAHLQDYLHEFEFRFNRRGASKPGLLFYRLLEQSVRHVPVTYDIVARSVRMLNRGHHGTQQAHRGRRHPPRDPRHWTQVPLLRRGHPARRHQVQALRRDAHHSLTPDGRSLHPSHAASGGTFSQEKVEPCEVVGLRPAKL
ncbi:MAG: hypothetical protein NTU77_07605 [Actinobacteria bacterium]|nr:hypothetical protein [Actinomycetota bacterium]